MLKSKTQKHKKLTLYCFKNLLVNHYDVIATLITDIVKNCTQDFGNIWII